MKILDTKTTPDSTAGQEQRSFYYDTTDIIVVIYNVAKQESIYHVENKWQKEINDALKPKKNARNQENKAKLVVLGVNPEARFKMEATNMPPNEEFENEELLSRLMTKRNSVKKTDAEQIAGRVSIRGSRKGTQHFEVQNKRENIVHLFKGIIKTFVEEDMEKVTNKFYNNHFDVD